MLSADACRMRCSNLRLILAIELQNFGGNKPKGREREGGAGKSSKTSLSSILIVCAVEVIGKFDGERGFTKEQQTDFKFS